MACPFFGWRGVFFHSLPFVLGEPPQLNSSSIEGPSLVIESGFCIWRTNDSYSKTNPLAKKIVCLATSQTVWPHFVKHVFVVGFGEETVWETQNSCENTNHPRCWASMASMLGLFFQNHQSIGGNRNPPPRSWSWSSSPSSPIARGLRWNLKVTKKHNRYRI